MCTSMIILFCIDFGFSKFFGSAHAGVGGSINSARLYRLRVGAECLPAHAREQ
jgi:hypothetical protein